MNDEFEIRLRSVELLLGHLIARTTGPADIEADRDELQGVVDRGDGWRLITDMTREQSRRVIETAVGLLETALFQQRTD